MIGESRSLALIDRSKWLIHVESCYAKTVKLLNKDSFPYHQTFASGILWRGWWREAGPQLLFGDNQNAQAQGVSEG